MESVFCVVIVVSSCRREELSRCVRDMSRHGSMTPSFFPFLSDSSLGLDSDVLARSELSLICSESLSDGREELFTEKMSSIHLSKYPFSSFDQRTTSPVRLLFRRGRKINEEMLVELRNWSVFFFVFVSVHHSSNAGTNKIRWTMDITRIGNGGLPKPIVPTDVVPSSSSAIGHLITNPLDECQTSSARDSGCYSSTADELHLMQPQQARCSTRIEPYQKQRKATGRFDEHERPVGQAPFDKVVINVSGLRFETRASTLQRYPQTLLGDKQRRAHFFDYMNNEYFFERHRSSFEAVLYFYQSGGRLSRPENISAEIFLEEIKFFDLGKSIEAAKRGKHRVCSRLGNEVLKRYRKQEGYVEEIPVQRPVNNLQRAIWEAFECPESSNIARVVAIISIVMITVSIATFIIETLPSIRNEPSPFLDNNHVNNASHFQSSPSGNETRFFWIFFIIETICVTWFSFEFVCRFVVAPSKFSFIKNGPNIIDVVSIIPYFIQLIGLIYQKKDSNVSGFSSTLTVLRIVRLVRVFRIFKLSRHFKVSRQSSA